MVCIIHRSILPVLCLVNRLAFLLDLLLNKAHICSRRFLLACFYLRYANFNEIVLTLFPNQKTLRLFYSYLYTTTSSYLSNIGAVIRRKNGISTGYKQNQLFFQNASAQLSYSAGWGGLCAFSIVANCSVLAIFSISGNKTRSSNRIWSSRHCASCNQSRLVLQ